MLPRIVITMGDPAGVGPEIVARAAVLPTLRDRCRLLLCGDPETMERAVRLTGVDLEVRAVGGASEARHRDGELDVLRGAAPEAAAVVDACPQALGGETAYRYLETAVGLVLGGGADAIVTAPISKEALWMAGHRYPGHTEILSILSGGAPPVLMLVDGPRRVVHATCHVPLGEVAGLLDTAAVLRSIELGAETSRRLGAAHPRVGVCGLNPHCGEGGLFGDQESRVIAPAIEEARRRGIDASGPHPADTLFVRAFSGEFDLAVAMYHDQGHVAFKLAAFQAAGGRLHSVRGVNVTLGLPLVRTSVDHGTAWDIAWKGVALPDSLLDAVDLAVRLVRLEA